eukprot:13502457-Alexandrium_andersonii.AAC.1
MQPHRPARATGLLWFPGRRNDAPPSGSSAAPTQATPTPELVRRRHREGRLALRRGPLGCRVRGGV